MTSLTPSNFSKSDSMHQKHPPAKMAFSAEVSELKTPIIKNKTRTTVYFITNFHSNKIVYLIGIKTRINTKHFIFILWIKTQKWVSIH